MSGLSIDQQLERLTTESVNPLSDQIDTLSSLEIVRLINREDALIAEAVAKQEQAISEAIDVIADRIRRGGRLVYIGAGTSGRLGVLDASECPPTFNTPPELVVGLIAGGDSALRCPAEGVEDIPQRGEDDLRGVKLCSLDVVVGIATSGRTPYVIGGLTYANSIDAFSIGLACNEGSPLSNIAALMITPIVGPELISGSTRMKAGTATKMILNMLTTGVMVQLGKTYGNLMVDLRASNTKLVARTRRLMSRITGISIGQAQHILEQCDGDLKTAVVCHQCGVSMEQAQRLLRQAKGHLRTAIELGQRAPS
ncbi:N-acetylmuramic acid 6-phosphate etherase [Stieleria sp. JC731]|nr:N-acetylmuramic acid 6-phosphate etherase [Stieleria sp. JC731]MCC9603899.1 N-acetylmuramic acid 6-phosphate etherase [Stieleria sp. JC731]